MKHENLHAELIKSGKRQTFETYYSKIDESYGEATNSPYHQHRLLIIGDLIRSYKNEIQSDSIVDFGCGDGLFAPILCELSNNIICIDPSEHLLEKCKNRMAGGGTDYCWSS